MTVYIVICTLIVLYYMALMLSFIGGWVSYGMGEKRENEVKKYKLSVIIACRNEQDNLVKCLDSIVAQNYAKEDTEIIVVDDHSSDGSINIVRSYKEAKLIESIGEGKKTAINTGIDNATGEIIVITDADCFMGEDWLTSINREFNRTKAKMICGPVSYIDKKGFFNKWQTLDIIGMVGMSGGGINIGAPNTCNGANLAYKRDAFYEVDGFKGNDGIPSGDDDFLMHKIADKYKGGVKFLQSKKAIVYTAPQPSLSKFVNQRIRWVSKSTKYEKKSVTLIMVMLYLFNLSLALNFVLGFWVPLLMQVALIQFGIKLAIEGLLFAIILPFFDKQKLFWIIIQAELFHILYVLIIGVRGNFGKYTWKNRVVKK